MKVRRRGERGQMLIMFVGFVTVFLVMAAVVVDFGLWLAERREVQRVADLAAAAGAQDLPGDVSAAIASTCKNAGANGYGTGAVDGQCGTSGSDVTVGLVCRNNLPSSLLGVCHNANAPGLDENCSADCDSLRVTITKPASVLFSSLFGVGDIEVSSGAAAGMRWSEVAVDGVVLLQTTGSMAQTPNGGCINANCPVSNARFAADQFVNYLFNQTNGRVQLGYSAYSYCYKPDWTPPASRSNECVTRQGPQNVVDLTANTPALHSGIDTGLSLGGMNLCLPLLEARRMFSVPQAQHGTDVKRVIVILADGDNNFDYSGGNPSAYPAASPAPGCRPTTVAASGACSGGTPSATERDMDTKAYQQAQALKQVVAGQQPVEIYVVGLQVCGTDDGKTQATAGYCSSIGNAQADAVADQRLLKCIASSPSDYFRVPNASLLAGTFTQIAERIIGRRLLQ